MRVKADDVIDKFWPIMTADQVLQRTMYCENDQERSEVKKLIENLLALVVA